MKMNHTTDTSLARSALLMAAITLCASAVASGQSSAFTVTTILKRGDMVSPDTRFVDCDFCVGAVQGLHALNNSGDLAVQGDTRGACVGGDYEVSGNSVTVLGDYCAITPFGKFYLLGPGGLNDSGDASELTITIPAPGEFSQMISIWQNGLLSKIAAVGDPSPAGSVFGDAGFDTPSINNSGVVVFGARGDDTVDPGLDGVFYWSGGTLHTLAVSGDPSPAGGPFNFHFLPPPLTAINDAGDILFQAAFNPSDGGREKEGLFISRGGVFTKVAVSEDSLPGGKIPPFQYPIGDINNKGDVSFRVPLDGSPTDEGIFLYSGGQFAKIARVGDPSPMGTPFSSFSQPGLTIDQRAPGVDDNGSVIFKAFYNKGRATGIFIGSPTAIVKVAARGDVLPTGDIVGDITSFAINSKGQVAFFAYKKDGSPLGVFLATPLAPSISKVKLKSAGTSLVLKGSGFITNDSVIQIDGQPIQTEYPASAQQTGGTTTKLVSNDARLSQLLPPGQAVQVTVTNRLTAQTSTVYQFSR